MINAKLESPCPMAYLSQDPPYLFVYIPRTAGTSLKAAVKRNARERGHSLKQVSKVHNSLATTVSKVSLPENTAIFCTVRNPWERLISRYLSSHTSLITDDAMSVFRKPIEGGPAQADHLDIFRIQPEGHFSEWVLTDKDKPCVNGIPFNECAQSNWIECPEVDEKNLIVHRFENVRSQVARLSFLLGDLELEHLNHTRTKRNYREYYSKEAKEHVEHFFRKDIERFGFEF